MKMTIKYEIYRETCEIRCDGPRGWNRPWSAEEIFDAYNSQDNFCPTRVASYDTEEEALVAWEKDYANSGSTRLERGSAGFFFLAEVYYLEAVEYDEDGNLDQGHGVIRFAVEAYVPDHYWDAEAEAVVENGQYDAAVALMDDDLREELHAEVAPCEDAEFLAEYARRHFARFGEEFEAVKDNPVW